MIRRHLLFSLPLAILIAALAVPLPGHSQSELTTAARAQLGKKIAKLWCSHCHLVDPTDTGAVQSDVPTFAEIADREGQTEIRLQKFMLDPHPPMPKLDLSREDRSNLVAYIQSLKAPN